MLSVLISAMVVTAPMDDGPRKWIIAHADRQGMVAVSRDFKKLGGSGAYGYLLFQLAEPKFDSVGMSLVKIEFDCLSNRQRTVLVIIPHLNGEVPEVNDKPTEWIDPAISANLNNFQRLACGKIKNLPGGADMPPEWGPQNLIAFYYMKVLGRPAP
jgi:hypothetical protein